MITKEITLCGKQVTLAYCFATEISYKILSDEDISDFIVTAFNTINAKRMPDTRKSIYLVLAAIQSYYESLPVGSDGKKPTAPVTDHDLMYNANTEELVVAIITVLSLYVEFNHIPTGEPDDKKSDDEPKNA